MSRNRQHQWEPVPGPDNLVKCKKCGTEVKASRARRGAGPCIWGEAADLSSVPEAGPPSVPIADQAKEINLCEACHLDFGSCDSEPEYGAGIGHDNVVACVAYISEADFPSEAYQKSPEADESVMYPGPRLTDPPEYCNVCGEQIAILPLNSRLDMTACNNRKCALYRERLRMVTKPKERGKRRRAKS